MKTIALITATIAGLLAFTPASHADTASEKKATYKDIKDTLGFVPGFLKEFPDEGIAAAWDEMKAIQMNPDSALPGETKELIGLAVAAQIPCRYCIYFHRQFAKLNGAGSRELKEAVAMAALTRFWSTALNGLQIDFAAFKKEMTKVFAYVSKGTPPGEAITVTDAATAYQDIERTLGMVPSFVKAFPEDGIAAAWREMKTVQLNPETALSGKTKELIGLAVASQIPCQYCIYFHTEAAKLNGATEDEIGEAVAMAAATRHWSTVLNGALIDEAEFRKEVDRIVKRFKKASAK